MEIMVILKAAENLDTLTLEFHSSRTVRLDTNLIFIVNWVVSICELKTLRLSFTKKSLEVDSLRISVVIAVLNDHFQLDGRTPVTNNTTTMVWEWRVEPDQILKYHVLTTRQPSSYYHQEMRWAYIDDRMPILGMMTGQDNLDEMLASVPDNDEDGEEDWGLDVLIPKPITQTRLNILKSQAREAGRRIVRPVGYACRRVSEVRDSVMQDVRDSFRREEPPKREHGKVRYIIL